MRRLLPVLLTASLIAAACGSDSDSAAETTAPVTTEVSGPTTQAPLDTAPASTVAPVETAPPTTEPAAPEVTAADLAAEGPYAVGVTTRTLPEGGDVEIWFPADESSRGGTVSYDVSDFLPEGVAQFVTSEIDDTFTIEATRDAAPAADGPFPIVLFSHGAASFRLQSSELAHHLASWGIVTASTDHPARDLLNRFGGTAEGQPPAIDQMRAMRALLADLDDDALLAGTLDDERVALGGHSAGGGTVAEMASDPGILGYVSYASGLGDARPAVPSLFMAGALDSIVDPVERTRAAFDAAPPPSWLWVFDRTGHLAFSDLCAIGGDSNLIDLGEQAGLGDFLDENIRRLATDGCDEPNRPVQEVWPGIHQGATGFYRWVFGIDPEPVGLDESAVTDGVAITSR